MDYYVYFIRSLKSSIVYVGMAKDVNARLKQHNSGKSRFTKAHTPWELIYQEGPYPREEARLREKKLKQSDAKNRILKSL